MLILFKRLLVAANDTGGKTGGGDAGEGGGGGGRGGGGEIGSNSWLNCLLKKSGKRYIFIYRQVLNKPGNSAVR